MYTKTDVANALALLSDEDKVAKIFSGKCSKFIMFQMADGSWKTWKEEEA